MADDLATRNEKKVPHAIMDKVKKTFLTISPIISIIISIISLILSINAYTHTERKFLYESENFTPYFEVTLNNNVLVIKNKDLSIIDIKSVRLQQIDIYNYEDFKINNSSTINFITYSSSQMIQNNNGIIRFDLNDETCEIPECQVNHQKALPIYREKLNKKCNERNYNKNKYWLKKEDRLQYEIFIVYASKNSYIEKTLDLVCTVRDDSGKISKPILNNHIRDNYQYSQDLVPHFNPGNFEQMWFNFRNAIRIHMLQRNGKFNPGDYSELNFNVDTWRFTDIEFDD